MQGLCGSHFFSLCIGWGALLAENLPMRDRGTNRRLRFDEENWMRLRLGQPGERGAFETLGVLIGLFVLALVLGGVAQAMTQEMHMTGQASVRSQGLASLEDLAQQLERDAAQADAIYYGPECAQNGSCDDLRFAKRMPEGSWSMWGYTRVGATMVRCPYSAASDRPCTAATPTTPQWTSLVAFRSDTVDPSAIVAAVGGPLSGLSPEVHATQVYANDGDPDAANVVSRNVVYAVRMATVKSQVEVDLLPGILGRRVAELGELSLPAPRSIVGGGETFEFVQGSPALAIPQGTDPQSVTYYVDRYNGGFSITPQGSGASGVPANGSRNVNCGSVGKLSFSDSPDPGYAGGSGVTSALAMTVADAAPGACSWTIAASASNPGDDMTVTDNVIVFGPLDGPASVTFQNPLEISAGVAGSVQTVSVSQSYITEGGQSFLATSDCAGIASVAAGATANDAMPLTVTAIAPGSCAITVTGALGSQMVIPVTVGNYNGMTVTLSDGVGCSTSLPGNPSCTATNPEGPAGTTLTGTVVEANDPVAFTLSVGACLPNATVTLSGGALSITSTDAGVTCSFSVTDGHGQQATISLYLDPDVVGPLPSPSPGGNPCSGISNCGALIVNPPEYTADEFAVSQTVDPDWDNWFTGASYTETTAGGPYIHGAADGATDSLQLGGTRYWNANGPLGDMVFLEATHYTDVVFPLPSNSRGFSSGPYKVADLLRAYSWYVNNFSGGGGEVCLFCQSATSIMEPAVAAQCPAAAASNGFNSAACAGLPHTSGINTSGGNGYGNFNVSDGTQEEPYGYDWAAITGLPPQVATIIDGYSQMSWQATNTQDTPSYGYTLGGAMQGVGFGIVTALEQMQQEGVQYVYLAQEQAIPDTSASSLVTWYAGGVPPGGPCGVFSPCGSDPWYQALIWNDFEYGIFYGLLTGTNCGAVPCPATWGPDGSAPSLTTNGNPAWPDSTNKLFLTPASWQLTPQATPAPTPAPGSDWGH